MLSIADVKRIRNLTVRNKEVDYNDLLWLTEKALVLDEEVCDLKEEVENLQLKVNQLEGKA
jgi:hypothetical protein